MSNSTVVGQPSAYDLLVESAPRFVEAELTDQSASLFGQAVADVLTSDPTDEQLRGLVETLESLRSSIPRGSGNGWNASIVGFLGLLRQHLRNRRAEAAVANPASVSLRDKILTAVGAGFSTPTAISSFVDSPVTVVSRTLRKLLDDGLVERIQNSPTGDGRVRRYAVVAHRTSTGSSVWGQVDDVEKCITEPSVLIPFAERQIQTNPKTATELVPDLVAVGRRSTNSPSERVAALSAASVITRATGGPDAAGLAGDFAQMIETIAREADDELLLAWAAYDSARAGLVSHRKAALEERFQELDVAERHLARREDAAAHLRRGWIDYTRGLLLSPSRPEDAEYRGDQAAKYFGLANSDYGRCASLILIARSLHHRSEGIGAIESAEAAFAIAQEHNYVRLLAESSLWLGEALVDHERARAERLFRLSSYSFGLCGARSWHAIAECSRQMASMLSENGFDDAIRNSELLNSLVQLRDSFTTPADTADAVLTSWAYACISRRIGVVARHIGKFDRAVEYLGASAEIYSARKDGRGLALALAGLNAAIAERAELSASEDSFGEYRDWGQLVIDPGLVDYKALDRDLEEAQHRPTAELKAV